MIEWAGEPFGIAYSSTFVVGGISHIVHTSLLGGIHAVDQLIRCRVRKSGRCYPFPLATMSMTSTTKFIDLSHSLSPETQIYPSDPEFTITPHAIHGKDGYCVHKLSLGTHTGTHIDAPYHFFAEGKTIDQIPLSQFVGEAVVIDLSPGLPSQTLTTGLQERDRVTWKDLEHHAEFMKPGSIVLINTGWSKAHYRTPKYIDHPYLASEVADELLSRGVRVVGVDTLNPDETPPSPEVECPGGFKFHEQFLGGGGLITENVTNLEELIEAQRSTPSQKWIVNLMPLNLAGADGSPVRAFAYNIPV